MSTKVVIDNLPPSMTLEEVREVLIQDGWPLLKLARVEEGDLERLTIVAEVDVDPQTAKIMADQSGSHYFKGRKVTFYVAGMMG